MAKRTCRNCLKSFQKGCITTDILASKVNILNPPACLTSQLKVSCEVSSENKHQSVNNTTHFEKVLELGNPPTSKEKSKEHGEGCLTEIDKQSDRQPYELPSERPYIKSLSDRIRGLYTKLPFSWDENYSKILVAISLRNNQSGISRFVGLSRGTTQNRLRHLIQCEMVLERPMKGSIVLGGRQTLYCIHHRLLKILGHTEEALAPSVFDCAHNMSIYFPVTEGVLPKSDKHYSMKNWEGYWFINEDIRWKVQTIEAIQKGIRLYLLEEIQGKNIETIRLRSELKVIEYAYSFASKYHLRLGLPETNGATEYIVKDHPVAIDILGSGKFKIEKHTSINKSQSSGDLEPKGKAAQSYQDMVYGFPIVEGMVLDTLNKTEKIELQVDAIETAIKDQKKDIIEGFQDALIKTIKEVMDANTQLILRSNESQGAENLKLVLSQNPLVIEQAIKQALSQSENKKPNTIVDPMYG